MAATKGTRYDRRSGPRDRRLRVGDTEREAVAEILRQAHVAGRLDSSEFQERLERCLEAKTYAKLDELVADFPGEEAEPDRFWRAWPRRPWPFVLLPLAAIVAIASTGGHLLWLALPLFFLFVVRPFAWRSSSRGRWSCGPR